MLIRLADEKDFEAILEIYNHSIIHTTSVYTYDVVDMPWLTSWINSKTEKGFPVLIAEKNGEVAGFATFDTFRNWPGYVHSVEHSLHVNSRFRKQGIGKDLLLQLIAEAKKLKKHVLIGGIDAENHASIHLHKQLGFVEVGRIKEVGYKFDRWLDLLFLQLLL